ncbi:hypothetical protein ATN84_03600 [Paramesorhizobium deserti]|uniref:Autotransporter domain-containing protein n=1 Tax=Paramesorhizobium deserti TaxID=1494590 RepID=A0A135I0C4_9HYPH|nr:hypothetical protein ATN84_03600 [Paramesorhizobium deserti]
MVGRAAHATLVAALMSSVAPQAAWAADQLVAGGTTDNAKKTVSGTDTLTVEREATLDVDGTAITWDGASPAPGVTIVNNGTISSTKRGIDTKGDDNPRFITLINNEGAKIATDDDAFRINADVSEGVVTVENAGEIVSEGGQAIDFDSISSGQAKVTINNLATGEIRAEDADAIRPGEGGVVNNYGTIIANPPKADQKNDGVDMQDHAATVNNYAGGVISGARHGITSDVDVTVYNQAGASIIGRNGSGVGSDGTGTVVNYGLISGDADGVSELSDGDGIDIDLAGTIVNYGTIRGTGATGTKPGDTPNQSEGIAMGGGSIDNASADAVISGADNAILIDDSSGGGAFAATTINNAGTIRGENGFGIKIIGDQNDTLTNSGLIEGADGLAVDLGGGDDTLNVRTGAQFIGLVDGGEGTDTISLDGTGTFGGGSNFEYLNVEGGSWTLTGAQDYSGGINIRAGRLSVDGTLGGVLAVGAGSVLDGTGTIGSVTIAGTIAPGRSIGTLTVNGDYAQTAGSTYAVEVNAEGQSDLVDVTGTATLAGTVAVTPAAGTYKTGTRYTILSAAGGVSGSYDTLSSPSTLFVDFALAYDPANVYLDVTRSAVAYADVTVTENQRQTATGLESLGSGNALYEAIAALPDAASAQIAFDSLSGEIQASTKSGLIEDSRFVRDAINERLRAATAASPAATEGLVFWTEGYGAWGESDGNGSSADMDRSSGGFFVGGDIALNDIWRAGLAGGYGRSSFDIDDRASSADADTYTIAAYAGAEIGALGLRFGAAHSWHDVDTSRTIGFAGFADQAEASYDARTAQLFGEAGYTIRHGRASFEPFAGLAYVNLHTDGFSESGSAGLGFASDTTDVTYTTLGLRAATALDLGGMAAHLHGTLGWQHAFGDLTPTARAAFAGGSGFIVEGVPIAGDTALLKAGFDIDLSAAASLDISYTGRLAEDAQDHGFGARLSVKF